MPGCDNAAVQEPEDTHPRLLVITSSVFNPFSGGGITLTNLFRGWSRERLATAYADHYARSEEVCGSYFPLSEAEIGWVWPLGLLAQRAKRSRPAAAIGPPAGAGTAHRRSERLRRISARLSSALSEGLQDRATLTPRLVRWVAESRPALIYSLLGSLGYMRLVRRVADMTGAPIAIHMMDDWPAVRYRTGLLAAWHRRAMERELAALVRGAALCLGICPAMCEEFSTRYGRPFQSFSNALDLDVWDAHARRSWTPGRPFQLLYSGSIVPNAQLASLSDACQAVSELSSEGLAVELVIRSPWYLVERFRPELGKSPSVRFEAPTETERTAREIAAADVLLLPVNFDSESARFVRLSNPTKLPAYLASATPILAYGPKGVDQIDRARKDGWGHVVSERGVPLLKEAIRRLAGDEALRERLGRRGHAVAHRDHDAAIVRTRFQAALGAAAQGSRAAL
jgi:glycosyltransferase involved in cell wall biosynthesis